MFDLKTTWDLTCFSKDQIKSMTVKPGTNVHKQLCDSLSGKLIGDEKETETEDTSISNINVDENSSYSKNWSLTFLKQCNTHKIVCNEQKFPIGWIDGTGGGNVMEIRKEESASIAIKEAIKERNSFFEEKKRYDELEDDDDDSNENSSTESDPYESILDFNEITDEGEHIPTEEMLRIFMEKIQKTNLIWDVGIQMDYVRNDKSLHVSKLTTQTFCPCSKFMGPWLHNEGLTEDVEQYLYHKKLCDRKGSFREPSDLVQHCMSEGKVDYFHYMLYVYLTNMYPEYIKKQSKLTNKRNQIQKIKVNTHFNMMFPFNKFEFRYFSITR